MPEATELYRLYDANGILLYVGITMQAAGARLEQHSQTKSWWPLVTDIAVQRRPTTLHGGFERDELKAILNEFPMFNIRGVPWRERRPRGGPMVYDQLRNRAEVEGAVARLDDAGVNGRVAIHGWMNPKWFERRFKRFDSTRAVLVYLEDLYFQRAVGERQWQEFCTSGAREQLEAEFRAEEAERRALEQQVHLFPPPPWAANQGAEA